MKPESSNKYEEIDPPYLTNKLLNKDSNKKLSKLINLKGFFDDFFEVMCNPAFPFSFFPSYTTDR